MSGANYDGLTRNAWPGTWSPSASQPIVIDKEIRGGLRAVSGQPGDRLTDITGQRLEVGMLVYLVTGYTDGGKEFQGNNYYKYDSLPGEFRNPNTGDLPNSIDNWSLLTLEGQGEQGFTGSQGEQGFAGSQGDLGFTGSQGDIGYTGSIGFTGSQGDIGYTGSQGDLGFTGSQGDIGYTGSIGFTGSQGDIGYTGSQGEQGFTGSQGDTGFTGSQGEQGFTGSRGADGTSFTVVGSISDSSGLDPFYQNNAGDAIITEDDGHLWIWDGENWIDLGQIVGPTGFTGSQGDTGFTGSQGLGIAAADLVDGELVLTFDDSTSVNLGTVVGPKGEDGIIGVDGFTGSQGDIGYTGSQGIQGDIGFTGSQGDAGLGIANVEIIDDELFVTYDDSTTVNLGQVVGPQGFTGSSGLLTVGDGLVYDEAAADLQLDETVVKFDSRGNLIIPTGKSITFEDDIIKEAIAGALFPIRQTSAAPRFFTNKDFNEGVFWFNLGPDDGFFEFAGTVSTEDDLPLDYVGEVFDAYLVTDTGDVYLWAPLSTTDMKPGDFYYDDINASIFLCYEYTDPFTGDSAYNLLDLTPR